MRRLLIAIAAIAATAGGLVGCATPTPYQPAPAAGGRYGFGFSDQQIDSTHWRVSFAGNSLTSRETVEKYLLYRAADLTMQQGGDWFATAERKTERHSSFVGTGDPFYSEFGWGWSPYWNFHGARGWAGWDPWGPDPFMDVEQVDRYEAHAEIVVGHGPQPQGTRVYNAREVMQHLGPSIVPPTPRK